MRNETGEFELVLGNRQLLGGFFIIIILFCVFFSMGYILGRNSAPLPRQVADSGQPPASAAGQAPAAQSPQAQAQSQPPQAAEQPKPAEGTAPPAGTAQPGTEPAQGQAAAPPSTAPAETASAEPLPGETYLQVMAVKRPEAEVVVKTLKDKGFPALIGPGPNDLVRVLVGPYKDSAGLGQAKASLENAGFRPIVRKPGS